MATLQSGGVFSGGLLLAIACSWWYVRREKIPFLSAADVFAPGIALGHAFGRIGCLSAGCCYGRETHVPWAITFHNPWAAEFSGTPLNQPLHPTQLYEFVAEAINFALLYWLCKRKKFEGQIIALFMIIYGIERFVFEFFRGDPGRGEVLGGLMSGTQLIALGLVVSGFLIYLRRTPLRSIVQHSRRGSRRRKLRQPHGRRQAIARECGRLVSRECAVPMLVPAILNRMARKVVPPAQPEPIDSEEILTEVPVTEES